MVQPFDLCRQNSVDLHFVPFDFFTGKIVDVLKNGTFEEIDQAIKKCIIEAGDNPRGYNLCPGCTTPVDTTKENMIAFMNAAAKYGRGARKGYMPRGITEL